MALRRKHSVERTGVELLRGWAAASGGAPVGVSGRLRDAAEDLAIAADRRPGDLVAAASRFGWQAGDDGWPLAEIARWLETLARISGPAGKGLLTYEVAVALSAGWADGFLHGASRDDCLDPTTGLARVSVLELRLRQVYEHCAVARRRAGPGLRAGGGRRLAGRARAVRAQRGPGGAWPTRSGRCSAAARPSPGTATGSSCW